MCLFLYEFISSLKLHAVALGNAPYRGSETLAWPALKRHPVSELFPAFKEMATRGRHWSMLLQLNQKPKSSRALGLG